MGVKLGGEPLEARRPKLLSAGFQQELMEPGVILELDSVLVFSVLNPYDLVRSFLPFGSLCCNLKLWSKEEH